MRVLVADDQVLLLLDLIEQLAQRGVEAIPASNASEALARLDPTIDGVVTDVEMPGGVSGIEMAWQIARSHPHLPIVIASGRIRPRSGDIPPQAVFLAKPLRIGDVIAALSARTYRNAA